MNKRLTVRLREQQYQAELNHGRFGGTCKCVHNFKTPMQFGDYSGA